MTLKFRIIPCLDVKDGRVINGINYVDLVDLAAHRPALITSHPDIAPGKPMQNGFVDSHNDTASFTGIFK